MQTSDVWRQHGGGTPVGFSPGSSQTTEQSIFLQRLRELSDKRHQYEGRLDSGDWHKRLLDKALYSTYVDCLALGIGDEARDILHGTSSGTAGKGIPLV